MAPFNLHRAGWLKVCLSALDAFGKTYLESVHSPILAARAFEGSGRGKEKEKEKEGSDVSIIVLI